MVHKVELALMMTLIVHVTMQTGKVLEFDVMLLLSAFIGWLRDMPEWYGKHQVFTQAFVIQTWLLLACSTDTCSASCNICSVHTC